MNSKKTKVEELTDIQKYVTQENGTEAPYENQFWNFFEDGLYLDLVSSEVLFSSKDKFHSSCGWPSFFDSVAKENLVRVSDESMGMDRVEVRSKAGNCHLGHVFTDGPAPTGLRYCINSAALRFISRVDFKKYKLEKYELLFNDQTSLGDDYIEYATIGAGCFWGVESLFSKKNGIIKAVSGYCGGDIVDPTYEQICQGNTGHAEVVQLTFNPSIISYEEVLEFFWKLHDPTTLNAQGYDIGTQYRSTIFTHNSLQKEKANIVLKETSLKERFVGKKIVTEIIDLSTFYPAEEYHQAYYEKKYNGKSGPICHYIREE